MPTLRPFQPDRVPFPTQSPSLPTPLPPRLDLEIGSGTGEFGVRYANAHPRRFLIAVEKTPTRFRRLRHNAADAANLLPVHANAVNYVTHLVPPASISRCFILYPNPYPKREQANKRWHRMPFTEYLLSRLCPGGRLMLATNIMSYADEAREWFENVWGLIPRADTAVHSSAPSRPLTPFEQKYLCRGETCRRLCWSVPRHSELTVRYDNPQDRNAPITAGPT